MTQDKCERAVKALQQAGHCASHWEIFNPDVMGAPDDNGVWVEVCNRDLQDCHEFRIHDDEVERWGAEPTNK